MDPLGLFFSSYELIWQAFVVGDENPELVLEGGWLEEGLFITDELR